VQRELSLKYYNQITSDKGGRLDLQKNEKPATPGGWLEAESTQPAGRGSLALALALALAQALVPQQVRAESSFRIVLNNLPEGPPAPP